MINPKAEPIGNRNPYKRIDLAERQRIVVCDDCRLEYRGSEGDYCPKCGTLNK